MTLPVGNKTWDQICGEFGMNPRTAVWPADFYGKGGAPSSGPLSFADFDGRSGLTFDPQPGFIDGGNTQFSAQSASISASQAVVWNWSISGGVTANQTNGGTYSAVSFNCPEGSDGQVDVTATFGGNNYNWTITFTFGAG